MKLVLFFTYNISLKLWVDTGLFHREKLLYERHLTEGTLDKVYWVTYGPDDAKVADGLKSSGQMHKDIIVIPMPSIFEGMYLSLLYSILVPLIKWRLFRSMDIFKTNQMNGSWAAVFCKWLYRKPLIVRTGYTASIFAKKQGKARAEKRFLCVEKLAYRNANIAVVASCQDKKYICERHYIGPDKVRVLHNFIDTSVFKQIDCSKYDDRLIFVGRLNDQKNLFNIIDSVSKNDLELDIYGEGGLKDDLQEHAANIGTDVNFLGIVANSDLPVILNKYRYYILASLYEGMPKTLLEAMACGLVCIGTDVEGINEIIEDGINGYLAADTDSETIVRTIKRVVESVNADVSAKATGTIKKSFSLDTIVSQEKAIFKDMQNT